MRWLGADSHIVLDGRHGRPRPGPGARPPVPASRDPLQRTLRSRHFLPRWLVPALRPARWLVPALAVCGLIWAFLRTGQGMILLSQVRHAVLMMSVSCGFVLNQVDVSGIQRTTRDEIDAVLHLQPGSPVLSVDLETARNRIETIPWIKSARLERVLPDRLRVFVTEREPVALWQSGGKYQLIDESGAPLGAGEALMARLLAAGNFLQVVGEGAPDEIGPLRAMLAQEPDLGPRVKVATWISDRRWDLIMDVFPGGIVVKLPEDHPETRFHELADLERRGKILERQVSVIDFRLDDRLIVHQIPAAPVADTRAPPASHP